MDKGQVLDNHSDIIHVFKNALDRDMCKQSTLLRLYGNFFEVWAYVLETLTIIMLLIKIAYFIMVACNSKSSI